jgi:hypothetical protein
LTAAARDGRIIVRAETEEWLRQGPNKEWHRTGEQNAVRPDTLIPSPQPSTKTGASPLLTKQAQALGLIAPPIIDITPNAPSSAQAESSSEAQTPTIAAKHDGRTQGRPATLPNVSTALDRDLKRNNDR